MTNNQDTRPVIVFAGNPMEANIVRNLLENEGIYAFLKDEFIGTVAPWQAAPGGGGAVKVVVSSADQEEALEAIEAYQNKE
ncbi:putative signal transducing protein [Pontibacter harenae]|uniref:putative signal transducing protein n=1 Tax=Pontibacter harenae TaxID=2894083 RepID=UPI001E581135|nr:DUF2007 domain-containing protein [Pontibacter harenae]MCC9166698.1 DUF2007 domain-containing protein [Pontibacter harenae]